jgi:hypothetical protein
MNFSRKNTGRLLAISIAAASLMTASATSAMAADAPVVPPVSDGPVFVFSPADGLEFAEGYKHVWDDDAFGSSSKSDLEGKFTCSDDATGVRQFVSPIGSERTKSAWIASSNGAFIAKDSKLVQQFPMMIPSYVLGSQATIKAQGGDFSIGLACLKDNAVNFATSGLWFTTISVTPGTGEWVAKAGVTPPVVADPTMVGEVAVTAQTMSAPEGVLSLSVPTNAATTIGNPAIVNGLSTSTGSLGKFSVTDGRVLAMKGWTLTTTVADFVGADATNKISAAQLGVAPKVVSTSAAGVSTSIAQVAGSAKFPAVFATATAGSAVGTTVLDADLTFVAPADKAAGTYTSKMTLTLTSN